MKNPCANHLYL
uniref:Uncharacterized protein n=1 Tax=Arundo donax TaxID=35708 RepID=A0A0A9GQL3_ARUDO